jgi:hypothetical protein
MRRIPGWVVFGLFVALAAAGVVGQRLLSRPAPPAPAPGLPPPPPPVMDDVTGWRKIHVYVALCDNANQGIVPVPKAIGNGQDPASNLYWGCGSGVKTYFSRSREWQRLAVVPNPKAHVLERLVFRHASRQVYLVADAYDGAYIKETTRDALTAASGASPEAVTIEDHRFAFAGGADVIAYIGHNGLMDFSLEMEITPNPGTPKEAILLSCKSSDYFGEYLRAANATPLLWTTQFMCPEAYTLHDALTGWVQDETPAQIHERAAKAYSAHQRCSVRAAKRLLKTGW